MSGKGKPPANSSNDVKAADAPSTAAPEQASPRATGQSASTPASASSTPASTAPQRLDSVSRPSSARGRGGKPVTAPRPKFGARRSQASRQEQEQAERSKKEAEAAAAAEAARQNAKEERRFGYGRGRGAGRGARGGRGRGGHMGDARKEEPVASGPFSSGQVNSDGSLRRSGWSSGGGGGGSGAFGGGGGPGGSRSGGYNGGVGVGGSHGGGANRTFGATIKAESGTGDVSMGGMPIKREDGGYISSDDEADTSNGPKQNIDEMQIIDLTGADSQLADLQGLEPVRLTRVPHREYAAGLNDAEDDVDLDSSDNVDRTNSDKKKGKQKVRDVEMTGATERPKRPTAYSSSDTDGEPHIKDEPLDDDDRTGLVTPEQLPHVASDPIRDQTASPDTRRRAKAQIKALVDADFDDFPMPLRPKFQTQAEADEWDRKYADLKQIRDELGQLMTIPTPDVDGDTTMAENESRQQISTIQQERENGTYIFQFPPVLPFLEPVHIKDDPANVTTAQLEEAAEVDQEFKNKGKGSVDLTAEVKQEEGAESKEAQKSSSLPAGSVGKLRIHKSGKATLDWGGTSFLLGMGTDATFLQTILLAKMPEQKSDVKKFSKEGEKAPEPEAPQYEEDAKAVGLGMGQIRGKFILTPDLDDLSW